MLSFIFGFVIGGSIGSLMMGIIIGGNIYEKYQLKEWYYEEGRSHSSFERY